MQKTQRYISRLTWISSSRKFQSHQSFFQDLWQLFGVSSFKLHKIRQLAVRNIMSQPQSEEMKWSEAETANKFIDMLGPCRFKGNCLCTYLRCSRPVESKCKSKKTSDEGCIVRSKSCCHYSSMPLTEFIQKSKRATTQKTSADR